MVFTQFLTDNFGLPGGGLWANLIASGLLGLGGFIYGRAFERRAIERHEALSKHITEHHEALKDHINMHMDKLHQRIEQRHPGP